MAAIEYSGLAVRGSGGATEADEDRDDDARQNLLFEGLKFFLAAHIPQKNRYKEKIEQQGGVVVKADSPDVLVIVDHLRKNQITQSNAYSYEFIDVSIRHGSLQDKERFHVSPSGPRQAGDTTVRPRSGRVPFNKEEDCFLWDRLMSFTNAGGAPRGKSIFLEIAQERPRHSWQSWRDRWIKQLEGKPRPVPLESNGNGAPPGDVGESEIPTPPTPVHTSMLPTVHPSQHPRQPLPPPPLPIHISNAPTSRLSRGSTSSLPPPPRQPRPLYSTVNEDNASFLTKSGQAGETVPETKQDDEQINGRPADQTVNEEQGQVGIPLESSGRSNVSASPMDQVELMKHAAAIFDIDPELKDEAWESWAQAEGNEHHTAKEWEQIWEQIVRPTFDAVLQARQKSEARDLTEDATSPPRLVSHDRGSPENAPQERTPVPENNEIKASLKEAEKDRSPTRANSKRRLTSGRMNGSSSAHTNSQSQSQPSQETSSSADAVTTRRVQDQDIADRHGVDEGQPSSSTRPAKRVKVNHHPHPNLDVEELQKDDGGFENGANKHKEHDRSSYSPSSMLQNDLQRDATYEDATYDDENDHGKDVEEEEEQEEEEEESPMFVDGADDDGDAEQNRLRQQHDQDEDQDDDQDDDQDEVDEVNEQEEEEGDLEAGGHETYSEEAESADQPLPSRRSRRRERKASPDELIDHGGTQEEDMEGIEDMEDVEGMETEGGEEEEEHFAIIQAKGKRTAAFKSQSQSAGSRPRDLHSSNYDYDDDDDDDDNDDENEDENEDESHYDDRNEDRLRLRLRPRYPDIPTQTQAQTQTLLANDTQAIFQEELPYYDIDMPEPDFGLDLESPRSSRRSQEEEVSSHKVLFHHEESQTLLRHDHDRIQEEEQEEEQEPTAASSGLTTTTPGNTAEPAAGLTPIPSQRNTSSGRSRSYIATTQPGFTSQPEERTSSPAMTEGREVRRRRRVRRERQEPARGRKTSLINSDSDSESDSEASPYGDDDDDHDHDDDDEDEGSDNVNQAVTRTRTKTNARARRITDNEISSSPRSSDFESRPSSSPNNDMNNNDLHSSIESQSRSQTQLQSQSQTQTQSQSQSHSYSQSHSHSQSQSQADLESWISRQKSGSQRHSTRHILAALHASTLQLDVAELALGYLRQTGDLPRNTRGVWTAADDADLRGVDARRVRRVIDKHGDAGVRARVEFLANEEADEDEDEDEDGDEE